MTRTGGGPENINLDNPENTDQLGAPYRVGVHYYRATRGPFGGDDTYGSSNVTIRIYFEGELVSEMNEVLQDTNDFWDAAAIVWTDADKRVVEIDQRSVRLP